MVHHCYINGKIELLDHTQIKVTDLGLLRGYGLFDYFRTYNGKPFQWNLYWQRFENSANKMNIPIPILKDNAYDIVKELVVKSGLKDCAIRFVLTGGYALDGITMTQPNLLIMSEDIHEVTPQEYEKGISVMTYEFVRDIPDIKSTDYKHLLILQGDLKAAQKNDVLFHKRGEVSELSRSNIFHFKDQVLVTPSLNILNGITRQTVLELAKPHFKIEERSVSLEEFSQADECFTTSSTKRILAISQIDDKIIGQGKMGPKTAFLQNLINEMVESW